MIYELKNGKCEKIKNLIRATYISSNNQNIELISDVYTDIIIREVINNKEIIPPSYQYFFESEGNHEVRFYINLENIYKLTGMFYSKNYLISISFENFDTQGITDMSYMFYNCISLISFDFSNLAQI